MQCSHIKVYQHTVVNTNSKINDFNSNTKNIYHTIYLVI